MKTKAYAKVNFTLEVLGERQDGYHDLRSVVVPVSLSDELEITDAENLTSDFGKSDDICLRAVRALDANRGAKISIVKRIPIGGGLGGGSADAAAVLNALNEMWKLGHTKEALAKIGASVGSDVPSLVVGGKVLMEGRGEIVKRINQIAPGRINLVLVNPGCESSTAEVYSAYRASVSKSVRRGRSEAMIEALRSGNHNAIACALSNDLLKVACVLHPQIARAMADLRALGAEGVSMSGSGATVFALAESEDRARTIAEKMAGLGYSAMPVHTV